MASTFVKPRLHAICCLSTLTMIGICVWSSLVAELRAWQEPAEPQRKFVNSDDPSRDVLGDPLPPQAMMRFGTERFCHPGNVHAAALSSDGQILVTLDSTMCVVWQTRSGTVLRTENWQANDSGISGTGYGQRLIVFGASGIYFYTPGDGHEILQWDATAPETPQPNRISLPPIEKTPLQQGLEQVAKRLTDFFDGRGVGHGPIPPIRSVDVTQDEQAFLLGSAAGLELVQRNGARRWAVGNIQDKDVEVVREERDRLWFSGEHCLAIFSPDDSRVAAVFSSNPREIRLLNALDGTTSQRIGLTDNLVRMDFTIDGEQIVCTQRDCSLRCYAVDSAELVWEYQVAPAENAESYLADVECSPDGRLVAVGASIGPDNVIYLIDAESGAERSALRGSGWKPWTLDFTADSKTLYTNGWEGTTRLWDVERGIQLPPPMGLRASSTVTLSSDGTLAAFADDVGRVRIVRVADGEQIATFTTQFDSIDKLTFDLHAENLFCGGTVLTELRLAAWNLANGEQTAQGSWAKGRDPHSSVEALRCSQDGSRLAVAVFRQSNAYLSDRKSGLPIATLPHRNVYGMDISPDSQFVLTAGWDNFIRRWSCIDGSLQQEVDVREIYQAQINQSGHFLANPDLRMYGIVYSPGGKRVAALHMSNMLSFWDVADNGALQFDNICQLKAGSYHGAICYTIDGQVVIVGHHTGEVGYYDAHTGKTIRVDQVHSDGVDMVATGAQLVASGGNGVAYISRLRPDTAIVETDAIKAWNQLIDDNAEMDYDATWGLAIALQNDGELLAWCEHRIMASQKLVNLAEATRGLDPQAATKRLQLARKVADSSDETELTVRLRAAFMALKLAGKPATNQLLADVAAQHSQEAVRELSQRILDGN